MGFHELIQFTRCDADFELNQSKELERGLIIFHLFVSYTKLIWSQPVLRPSVD